MTSSPGSAVISAYLSALVEGDTIVGWLRNSAFSVQEVRPNGTLAPLDLTPAKLALPAYDADMEASKAGIVGVTVLPPDATTSVSRDLIIALAARYRLPAVYSFRLFVKAGGLMSYGVDFIHQNWQAASYVDRILRGEKARRPAGAGIDQI
jgi:hypothetical protein